MNIGMFHMSGQEIDAETALIIAAQSVPEKFEPLYNNYYERILSFIYLRVETKEQAYELTSQVFFNALSNIRKYKFKGLPFGAWLFQIAINETNKFFKQRQDKRVISLDENAMQEIFIEMEEEKQEDADKKLAMALQMLSEEEVQLIELRYYEKMPFKKIAELLELSEAGVKARVYRALEKMKLKIQKP